MQENKILNKDEIGDKIKRISYEIYEENFNEKSIVICGIENNGTIIAKKVIQELESISKINIEFLSIELDKRNPLKTVKLKDSNIIMKDKSIILRPFFLIIF